MRTIKFRGKSLETDDWVYGFLADGNLICTWDNRRNAHEVLSTTVGQFTGLTDKNGKEIYEGDILLNNGNRRIVEWKYGTFGLSMHENGFPFQAFYELPVPIVDSAVIGNIHDNPELIEKGGEK